MHLLVHDQFWEEISSFFVIRGVEIHKNFPNSCGVNHKPTFSLLTNTILNVPHQKTFILGSVYLNLRPQTMFNTLSY